MYGNGLVEACGVLGWSGVFLGGFEYFDGPHDGYANRSNSQTSLPQAIGQARDRNYFYYII